MVSKEDLQEMREADCFINIDEPMIIYTPSDVDVAHDFIVDDDNYVWVTENQSPITSWRKRDYHKYVKVRNDV